MAQVVEVLVVRTGAKGFNDIKLSWNETQVIDSIMEIVLY